MNLLKDFVVFNYNLVSLIFYILFVSMALTFELFYLSHYFEFLN